MAAVTPTLVDTSGAHKADGKLRATLTAITKDNP